MAVPVDFKKIRQDIESKLKATPGAGELKPDGQAGRSGLKMPVSSDRIQTGIFGFDDVIGGGLEKNSSNLIVGGAGTGKSIFATQFLVHGITECGEPGLYISFEESKKSFYKHMKDFGWDLQRYEDDGMFTFFKYTPEQVGKLLEEGGGVLESTATRMGAKRLVIDSLTAFSLLYHDELQKREAVLTLLDILSKWGCTTVLTLESDPGSPEYASTAMEFEVDGVIVLYNLKKGDIRERSIEILKMRGTKHAQRIFPLRITDEGLMIYPEETVF